MKKDTSPSVLPPTTECMDVKKALSYALQVGHLGVLLGAVLGVIAGERHGVKDLTSHSANVLKRQCGVIDYSHLADAHVIVHVHHHGPGTHLVVILGALRRGIFGTIELDVVHFIVAGTADEQMGGGDRVEVILLGDALVHRQVALILVHVAREVHIHAVLVEQLFHGGLEVFVDGGSLVHWVVAGGENPGAHCAVSVGFDEVRLEPGQLVTETAARKHVLGFLGSTGKASLCVDGDEVHVAIVKGVVHVEHSAGLRGGHAEAVVVCSEVGQLLAAGAIGQASRIMAIYSTKLNMNIIDF